MTQKTSTERHDPSIGFRRTEVHTVKELIDKYIYRIDLDADYQRENVWSKEKQEELLDSILKDIDIPKLYLAEVRGKRQFDYECIDGKQRMLTLLHYFKPDKNEGTPLSIDVFRKKYTYNQLKKDHPSIAKKLENYKLDFVIYDQADLEENFIREIFRRLQLGIRLNSGEVLHSLTGTIRDFIFKDIGKYGPLFRNTRLSEKRFSREFTLAQICINSFKRTNDGEFVRARLDDIKYFLEEESKLTKSDDNLRRIKEVLEIMDKSFGKNADRISSRATAVSAFLRIEKMYIDGETALIPQFAKFYITLLDQIKEDMALLRTYDKPKNTVILEQFQKYILQASVESYSIERRDDFLRKGFAYFVAPSTKGKIIGSK
jgi:hypothetical protein